MTDHGSDPAGAYDVNIGLEVHAQLRTASKMFCLCSAIYGAPPNTRTCPTCLGLPGALPVPNAKAVDLAASAALALGCAVSSRSCFARKHYFYPDLPKGYQITQHDRPLATGGALTWRSAGRTRTVRLVRVHLEEDAGKSLHEGFPDSAASAYLDFNRSGVPLVEIVTEPDLVSAADAAEFARRLRAALVAIGASDANMEEGGLRCDANVSLRRRGEGGLGVRTEIKNLNSFRALQRALEFEIARHERVLRAGGRVDVETRLWDDAAGRTVGMRTKEDSEDYRYFPEPDLPPLALSAERLARLRAALPELPGACEARLATTYGLDDDDAGALARTPGLASYFERSAEASGDPAAACLWVRGELARRLAEAGLTVDASRVTPEALGELIRMMAAGVISASAAKQVLGGMMATGGTAASIAAARGLLQESRTDALETLVHDTLSTHPDQVAQYRAGKRAVAGFLVGQVMKRSGGRANPSAVERLVRQTLDSPGT
ncbi:MAG: Asp-tRNA(Asn)/Glu-tRNA(Gln) amidotransferase subunit GatB [Vicinamibacterales bacterium]